MIDILRRFFLNRASAIAGADPRTYPNPGSDRIIYAIGDIHGRLDLLSDLHNRIDDDWANNERSSKSRLEVYLGDTIDRGPHSAGVIDALIVRQKAVPCVFISGNHELEFLRVVGDDIQPRQVISWLKFGGTATSLSYGVTQFPTAEIESVFAFVSTLRMKVPMEHRVFVSSWDLLYLDGPYLFVHAGIRPSRSLAAQSVEDLTGIRKGFLDFNGPLPFIVVHGHTPSKDIQFYKSRIGLDTGAYASNKLSCFCIGTGVPRIIQSKLSP